MSKLFDNNQAFEPFFDEFVKVVAERPDSRTIRGTFRASVNPLEFIDPMASSDAQSELQRFSVLIAARGKLAWIEKLFGSKPQIGDELTLENGLTAKVTRVKPLVDDYWELEAREC